MKNSISACKKNLSAIALFLFLAAGMIGSSAEHIEQLLVDVNVPLTDEQLIVGDSILVEVEARVIHGEKERTLADMYLEYTLKNQEGETLLTAVETKGGIEQISTVRELFIPRDAAPGVYTVEVQVTHGDMSRMASAHFMVESNVRQELTQRGWYILAMLIGFSLNALIFPAFIWYEHRKFKRIEKHLQKAEKRYLKQHGFIREKQKH